MSESVGQPVAPDPQARPDGTADTADGGADTTPETSTGPTADAALRPRPGTGPPGRPSLGWTEIGVAVAAWLLLSVTAGFVLGTDGLRATSVMLIVGSGSFLLAALIALVVRVRWFPAIGVRATTWRWLLAGVGVGVLMRLLAVGLVFGYQELSGDRSNPQDALVGMAAAGGAALVVLLLLGAVLTPLAEELMFRGVLFGALRRYGVWIAVIASALVFGIAHGVNVVLPVAVVLGLLNALLYERSGSIWPAVVAHAVHNGLGFAVAAMLL